MTIMLSTQSVLIATALRRGTLCVEERRTRFPNQTAFFVSDDCGLIEVHLTREEVDQRMAQFGETRAPARVCGVRQAALMQTNARH